MDKNTAYVIVFVTIMLTMLGVFYVAYPSTTGVDLIPETTINVDVQIDRDELEFLYFVYKDMKDKSTEYAHHNFLWGGSQANTTDRFNESFNNTWYNSSSPR